MNILFLKKWIRLSIASLLVNIRLVGFLGRQYSKILAQSLNNFDHIVNTFWSHFQHILNNRGLSAVGSCHFGLVKFELNCRLVPNWAKLPPQDRGLPWSVHNFKPGKCQPAAHLGWFKIQKIMGKHVQVFHGIHMYSDI